jgi:hypothetical protein
MKGEEEEESGETLVLPWAVIHTGVVDKRWRTLQRVEAIVG